MKPQHRTRMDIIFLRQVQVETIIGVYDWERVAPQTIELDLEIGIPSECAMSSMRRKYFGIL